MGGIYPAKVGIFLLTHAPQVGFSLTEESPWATINRLNEVLAAQASDHLKTELMMVGGWRNNEKLFERFLDLFQGSHGASDSMPSNEENCFFTIFTPAQVRLVLADLVRELGPLGPNDDENEPVILEIMMYLGASLLRDQFVVCTFSNPP